MDIHTNCKRKSNSFFERLGKIKYMSLNKQIFDKNIERVKSLCSLYNSLKTCETREESGVKFTDILRSATVLLHSSFEDYFRSTLRDVLSYNYTEEIVKELQIKLSDGKYKEKMTLVDLVQHKDKTIDRFIVDQIKSTLDSTSFNNYRDVVKWTKNMRVSVEGYDKQAVFEKLVARRHRIVHEADNSKTDQYRLTSIQESTVVEWIEAVCDLVEIIDSQLEKK